MIYLLTKNAKYYYDAEAIQEPYAEVTLPRQLRGVSEGNKWKDGADGQTRHTMNQPRENLNHSFYKYTGTAQKDYSSAIAQDPSETKRRILESMKTKGGANKKDVWTINTANCPEAHFATFPEEIPRLCIAAGSKKGQIILDPFAGSGTTGEVALRMERKFIGIELNETYTRELIKPRLNSVMPLFQKL
jgi:DNA modification methylase